jgi:hypothetical protein
MRQFVPEDRQRFVRDLQRCFIDSMIEAVCIVTTTGLGATAGYSASKAPPGRGRRPKIEDFRD